MGHSLSRVPLPMVAISWPFSMIALRTASVYDGVNVVTLELKIMGVFGMYTMRAVNLLENTQELRPVTMMERLDLRAIPFCPTVVLAASHPKNVGLVFKPKLTKVLISGITGNALPF